MAKIGNLLTKLRKKGIIYADEKRLWHLSENLSDFKWDFKRESLGSPIFRAFPLR